MLTSHATVNRRAEQGVLLLEVLIALLIFSLGVLGLVGLQGTAAKQSSQSKFRADATLLANELIGQMWVTSRNFADLQTQFSSAGAGGALYKTWRDKVVLALPGAGTCQPVVSFSQMQPLDAIVAGAAASAATLAPSSQVTIKVRWMAPSEGITDCNLAHNVMLVNEIK